jgi:hypothetical protein
MTNLLHFSICAFSNNIPFWRSRNWQHQLKQGVEMKKCNPEYLEKVTKLSKIERERLLSRMTGKLPVRIERRKITSDEALAIQMELEDIQLQEWRENYRNMLEMHEKKEKEKAEKKKKSE